MQKRTHSDYWFSLKNFSAYFASLRCKRCLWMNTGLKKRGFIRLANIQRLQHMGLVFFRVIPCASVAIPVLAGGENPHGNRLVNKVY